MFMNLFIISKSVTITSDISKSEAKRKRVAAYARVSTDKAEQITSYEMQVGYYTNYIYSNAQWDFVKVCTHEGILAVNTKHRDDFKEMIEEAIFQKSFVVNYLTKKTKRNEGEVPMYHVKNSHETIIAPEVFDLVQAEVEKRKRLKGSHSGHGVFSIKIVCGQCGEFYGPSTFYSNSKYRRIVWQFKAKLKKEVKCEAPLLYKENIEKIFVGSFNKLLKNKDEIIETSKEFIKKIDDTESLETEKARLCGESRLLYNKIQNYIDKNATETLNQNEYREHYNTLSSEHEKIKQKIEKIDTKLKNKRAKVISIENFLNEMLAKENLIDTFDEKLFTGVVDKIIVKSYTKAAIVFKNGQEIPLNLAEYK